MTKHKHEIGSFRGGEC